MITIRGNTKFCISQCERFWPHGYRLTNVVRRDRDWYLTLERGINK